MEHFNFQNRDFFNPILEALHQLGGSGNSNEIEEQVIQITHLTEEQINEIYKGTRTKLNYNMAWAKNYLKSYGLIENSVRGVWNLTEKGKKIKKVKEEEVVRNVFEKNIRKKYGLLDLSKIEQAETDEIKWEDELLETIRKIPFDSFERLCQRLLRELGFVDVKITGKKGDGGIDGNGIIKINGTLSFHVVFQAKRYSGNVPPSVIRDFRGAMIGRADKGLVITTGVFSREAILEARRDGAPNVDLIDGIDFVRKLKSLNLGVEIIHYEKVIIKKEWFENI